MSTFSEKYANQNSFAACAEMGAGNFAARCYPFSSNAFFQSADFAVALFFCVLSLIVSLVIIGIVGVLGGLVLILTAIIITVLGRIIKKLNRQSKSGFML